MNLIRVYNGKQLENHLRGIRDERIRLEKQISDNMRNVKSWFFDGYCECCKRKSKMLVDWIYSDGTMPNFRERLVCEWCKLNNRQRFMMGLVQKFIESRKTRLDIYLYEQVTNFYDQLNNKNINVTGSEYLGPDKTAGLTIQGVRHEDALNLSFEDISFDMIISNDVYEHVPDVRKSLSEACRVLKNDGVLLMSIPFTYSAHTQQRATYHEGKIINLLPEIYHGNPVSAKGSLVFYDYGWDFLTFCKECGFYDAYMLVYYSQTLGYLGNGFQSIFVADKSDSTNFFEKVSLIK